jgi:hypothetical protein
LCLFDRLAADVEAALGLEHQGRLLRLEVFERLRPSLHPHPEDAGKHSACQNK